MKNYSNSDPVRKHKIISFHSVTVFNVYRDHVRVLYRDRVLQLQQVQVILGLHLWSLA